MKRLRFAASVVLVLGVGMICAAALAALARSGSTYIDLGGHGSYRTGRYGLATASTNWRTTLLGWAGEVRLKLASEHQQPIFVGVATPAAIDPYLSRTAYTTIAERTGGGVLRTDHPGTAPTTPPATALRWTAHAEGVGTQTLHWNASDRREIPFAMNAHGSRPVQVTVVSSEVTLGRMPRWVPAGLLLLGATLLFAEIALLRRMLRPPRASA
jgi:hypothetical protein